MIGAFLITLTQLEKTGPTGRVFIPLEILKLNSTFETRNRSRFFSRHYHVRLWRVLFTSLSADEVQLNSKSAYIAKCVNILRLLPEKKQKKNQQELYKSLHYTTFFTLNKKKSDVEMSNFRFINFAHIL